MEIFIYALVFVAITTIYFAGSMLMYVVFRGANAWFDEPTTPEQLSVTRISKVFQITWPASIFVMLYVLGPKVVCRNFRAGWDKLSEVEDD